MFALLIIASTWIFVNVMVLAMCRSARDGDLHQRCPEERDHPVRAAGERAEPSAHPVRIAA
jgi:hypothetical protein